MGRTQSEQTHPKILFLFRGLSYPISTSYFEVYIPGPNSSHVYALENQEYLNWILWTQRRLTWEQNKRPAVKCLGIFFEIYASVVNCTVLARNWYFFTKQLQQEQCKNYEYVSSWLGFKCFILVFDFYNSGQFYVPWCSVFPYFAGCSLESPSTS